MSNLQQKSDNTSTTDDLNHGFDSSSQADLSQYPTAIKAHIVMEGEQLSEYFTQLVTNYEKRNLRQLNIENDSAMNCQTLANALLAFVKEKEITFDLLLPKPYQHTEEQREIDQLTSAFRRKKNIATFQKNTPYLPKTNNASPTTQKKRTRTRTHFLSLNIDTTSESEQAQIKQTELTRETGLDHPLNSQVTSKSSKNITGPFLDKTAFIQACLGEDPLIEEKYLFSKQDAEKLWDSLFDYQIVYWKIAEERSMTLFPPHMTLKTCKHILRHWQQFQFGMDFHHLPKGFQVIKSYEENPKFILDYDPTSTVSTEKNPLAIQLYSAPHLQALDHPLLTHYLQHAKKNRDNLDKIPLLLWKKLNKENKPYDRQAQELFNRYLPLLRSHRINEAIFLKLFFKADQFQKERFDFLFRNFRKIAALFPDKTSLTDPNKEAAKKILQEYFPEKLITDAIALSNDYVAALAKSPNADTQKKHLIYLLLNGESGKSSRLNTLTYWHQRLSLTTENLNALVQVLQTHGEPGLEKLFSLWKQWDNIKILTSSGKEESLLTLLHTLCFKNFQTYAPLLDPAYETAIERINGFYMEKNKGNYWETLLKQHYEAFPEEDLPTLVNAFKAFTRKLQDLALSFNSTPCQLKNIKSLPVALTRILSLLKNCRAEDRQEQWKCHDQLDLSNGTMQALCQENLFVIPQMQLKTNSNKGRSYVADTAQDSLSIDDIKEEDLPGSFFRFIASQKHALSLEFYNKALEQIENKNFSKPLRYRLYRCLAATTTGEINASFIKDTSLALEKWQNLLETIPKIIQNIQKKIPFPFKLLVTKSNLEEEISQLISESLSNHGTFSLPIFLQLMQSALAGISASENTKALRQLFEKVEKSLKYLTRINQEFYGDVYKGMRFYKTDNNSPDPQAIFLFRYCETIKAIDNSDLDDFLKGALISLISTFQLEKSNITGIIDRLERSHHMKMKTSGFLFLLDLSLLSYYLRKNHIKNKDGSEKKLTAEDLINFINDVDENYDNERCIRTAIKDRFAAYCDENTLALLEREDIPRNLKTKIKDHFSEPADQAFIINLLRKIKRANGVITLEHSYNLIFKLYQALKKNEKKNFLNSLRRLNEVDPEETAKKLNAILTHLDQNKQIQDFIYFIQKDQEKNAEDTVNLIHRLDVYLKIISETGKIPKSSGTDDEKTHQLSETDNKKIQTLLERLVLFPLEEITFKSLQEIRHHIHAILAYDTSYSSSFFDFFTIFIDQLSNSNNSIVCHIEAFTNNLCTLTEKSTTSHDLKSILGHLFYYCKKRPFELEKWINTINETITNPEYKVCILKIISVLLSQDMEFNTDNFSRILQGFQEKDQGEFHSKINLCYQSPPYPPIEKALKWWEKTKTIGRLELFQEKYDEFIKNPYPREKHNGFKLELARKQKDEFKGIDFTEADLKELDKKDEFKRIDCTEADLEELDEAVKTARLLTPQEIIQNLAEMKENVEKGKILDNSSQRTLVAYLAELLYRSKSKPGNSFELNTTQYLAIVAMLQSKGHVSSEIATGEGKSRIMMILAASQYILGKTTDFVTSNLQLAQRDYIEYLPFFNLLGAKTQLITSEDSFSRYQENAIHFTDITNLSLFRNKAQADQELSKTTDTDENRRCLLLDEADCSYFDLAQTRFNYSTNANKAIQEMEWIYPLLIEFVLFPIHEDLYYSDVEEHTRRFIAFAKAKINEEKIKQLDSLDSAQLEIWLESAMTAKHLKFNEHFVIKPDSSIATTEGMQIRSLAYVLHNNRVCKESSYSAGVHQCLHALLEHQRTIKKEIPDKALSDSLSQCNTPFYSDVEKQLICSSNSYDFLDYYQKGNILGVSGTLGNKTEKEEATTLYKKTHFPMAFIEVPPHQPRQRLDQPPRLAANSQRQAAILLEYIQAATVKNQPVLVISENDSESIQLQHAIAEINQKSAEKKRIPTDKFQCVSSRISIEEENELIDKAGQAGMVTFSTSRLGRGTDIPLDKKARDVGLLVLISYLPDDERDYQQIIGRSGRYNRPGESRMVIQRKGVGPDYYLNSEDYINSEWAKRTQEKQFHRLTEILLSRSYTHFQKGFSFDKDYRDRWVTFVKKIQAFYKKTRNKIIELYKKKQNTLDSVRVSKLNTKYQRNIIRTYDSEAIPTSAIFTKQDCEHKKKEADDLITLLQNTKKKESVSYQRRTFHDKYDPALDGRAKTYTTLFAETRATILGKRGLFANTRAAQRNEGILFADTRASLAGERPFFANMKSFLTKSSTNPTSSQERPFPSRSQGR